jgi:hypothetical protein
MFFQECRSALPPLRTIATFSGGAFESLPPRFAFLRLFFALLFMTGTVLFRQRDSFLTAWVRADMKERHKRIQANSRGNQPGIKITR